MGDLILCYDILCHIYEDWLDPKDISLLRATCKTLRKWIPDMAKSYRELGKDRNHIIELASQEGHKSIVIWANRDYNTANYALIGAARGGKIAIMEWAIQNGASDLEHAFKVAYIRNQTRVAFWMASIYTKLLRRTFIIYEGDMCVCFYAAIGNDNVKLYRLIDYLTFSDNPNIKYHLKLARAKGAHKMVKYFKRQIKA